MSEPHFKTIQCPYCWERISLEMEDIEGVQDYVEDCQICCQPILIRVSKNQGQSFRVTVKKENE